MPRQSLKLGLLAVILMQIFTLFYMLHAYDKFVSNPENYYKNYINQYSEDATPDNQ